MKIRQATTNDVTAMALVIDISARKFIIGEFSNAGKTHFLQANNAAKLREFIDMGFEYFVAEQGEEIIGLIGMRENSHLYHLFVAESCQGQGIARALWQTAMHHCLALGNPGRFTVNASNNAVGVYLSLGFHRTAEMQQSNGVLYNPMLLEFSR